MLISRSSYWNGAKGSSLVADMVACSSFYSQTAENTTHCSKLLEVIVSSKDAFCALIMFVLMLQIGLVGRFFSAGHQNSLTDVVLKLTSYFFSFLGEERKEQKPVWSALELTYWPANVLCTLPRASVSWDFQELLLNRLLQLILFIISLLLK